MTTSPPLDKQLADRHDVLNDMYRLLRRLDDLGWFQEGAHLAMAIHLVEQRLAALPSNDL